MNLNQELLKSFIIGSSIPSFLIFFIGVKFFIQYEESAIFDYHNYSILAPIGLGIGSLLAKYISIYYKYPLKRSYFIISLISALFICLRVTFYWDEVYQYKINSERGKIQYIIILIAHLFVYNFIIHSLDVYLH